MSLILRSRIACVAGLFLAASLASAYVEIGGVKYIESGGPESVTASFKMADAVTTTLQYSGLVKIEVSGVGQSSGLEWNDAFYVYSPGLRHEYHHYQLAMGTSILVGNNVPGYWEQKIKTKIVYDLDAGHEAVLLPNNTYVPAYRPDHTYTVIANTGLTVPTNLHFGVADGNYGDNTGAYQIKVTQLRPGEAPVVNFGDPAVLWPPNHEWVNVASVFSVSSPDDPNFTYAIKVFSDEPETPETGDGTGKFAPDYKYEPLGRGILLRAERQGPGDGRIYIAEVTATNEFGTTVVRFPLGVVPHDETPESLQKVLAEAALGVTAFEHGLAAPMGSKP